MTGNELGNIAKAHANGMLAGDGPFTKCCHEWLEVKLGTKKALLTHSCTAALEMAAILADIKPGDEIIMPSYTFVSTANAFVLRGGVPVFVDIRSDTLNLNEDLIEAAITPNTRAIVPVHYAGVPCEMDVIMEIANKHRLLVIEDAAQGIMSTYKGRPLGTIGHIGCLSFHETKNIISGEGGAILINDEIFIERAEIIREKGTDRSRFFRGQVDKYTWCDLGSSYLPGELIAAFLWAQLEDADNITKQRKIVWDYYHVSIKELGLTDKFRIPLIPNDNNHNAHMYYLLAESSDVRTSLLSDMKDFGVHAVFHYIPLHSSPAGNMYGRVSGDMSITDDVSARLMRLPVWIGVDKDRVIETLIKAVKSQL